METLRYTLAIDMKNMYKYKYDFELKSSLWFMTYMNFDIKRSYKN